MLNATRFLTFVFLLFVATTATAASTNIACRAGKARALARYEACIGKGLTRTYGVNPKNDVFSVCVRRLAGDWTELQTLTDTVCDAPRWQDNGNGSVTDNLTGLTWQKTDDAGGLTDKDNLYSWTDVVDGDLTNEDGTVFTDFLANLNAGAGFAGARGWRIPTLAELATIFAVDPWPCTSSPCIDPSVFGPTNLTMYWASTTKSDVPSYAFLLFYHDFVGPNASGKTDLFAVRAVRGGF